MGLETGTFLSDLNPNWPVPTDKIREGDDHLRLIKTTLLNTFPNLSGAVNLDQDQLNDLLTIVPALVQHVMPTGTIVAWSGSVGAIPDGWALCDGSGGTPDLRGRFIVGAGGVYAVGDTGGAATATTSSEGITVTVDGHALTEAELPSHRHLMFIDSNGTGTVTAGGQVYVTSTSGGDSEYSLDGGATEATVGRTSAIGSGTAHTHTASGSAHEHDVDTLPPYYALCWIQKTLTWDL